MNDSLDASEDMACGAYVENGSGHRCCTANDTRAQSHAAAPAALPFDADVQRILGMMNFNACPIAHLFRAAGADIPKKVEAEQAYVLHWLLNLYLVHGAGWPAAAEAAIREARDRIKALQALQQASEGSQVT